MYKSIVRPILFQFSAERAHSITISLLKLTSKIPGALSLIRVIYGVKKNHPDFELFGLRFKSRVGLAAGLDKNASLVDAFASMGFGFIEIGTVTPKPQPGNPKPRLFRLKPDHSIINRMGFNNHGMGEAKAKLKKVKSDVIVGGNIGKNKVTPNENAAEDYLLCYHELYDVVDYFVVNVSSPNTPGLRELQEKEPLTALLNKLCQANKAQPKQKPILLKIAPDLSQEQLDDIIDIYHNTDIEGIIATNTTISRDNLTTKESEIETIGNGGLSGQALRDMSTEVIRYLSKKSNGKIPIIGVGGIGSADDAIEKIEAGASLIQIYSALIYEGPSLVKSINKRLTSDLDEKPKS